MTIQIRDTYDESSLDLLQRNIDLLKESGEKNWQEKAVKLIRSSRLDLYDLELKRLRYIHALDPAQETLLDTSIALLETYDEEKKQELKIMIGRALEIQRIYKDTHDVLIHAQSTSWQAFPDLIKECMKVHYPEEDLHQFKFLRMPFFSRSWNIEHYSQNMSVSDDNLETRTDLISADAYYYHNEAYESALFFMSKNDNILGPSVLHLEKVIQFFHPEMEYTTVRLYAAKLASEQKKFHPRVGNLFVVCIPKEKSSEIQYRAHPFGRPCKCHSKEQERHVLDLLQKGALEPASQCKRYALSSCPQYRIFMPKLQKKNGVKIHFLSIDRIGRKQSKQRVRTIVREMQSLQRNLEKSLVKSW